jgi:hypothetical protein
VEARDTQRGSVREGAPELLGIGTGFDGVEQRVDDALGILVEQQPGEAGDVGERAVAGRAGRDGGVEPRLGALDPLLEVVRVAPGAACPTSSPRGPRNSRGSTWAPPSPRSRAT